MDELFQAQKENPPLHKNHPPVAGAIFWERSLFHRIKHTIVRFLTMEDMMQSEMGKKVSFTSTICENIVNLQVYGKKTMQQVSCRKNCNSKPTKHMFSMQI